MPRLSLSLLGPLQITLDGAPVTGFATDKTQALLIHLAVEADHPHRRDTLAGLLWPDQPQRKARQNLRQTLSFLRQALGEDGGDDAPFLLVKRETIQFNPDCSHVVDVSRFAALVRACDRHRHRRLETCLPCLRRSAEMIALYRGEFLEQFFLDDSEIFEEWATLKREWLHREAVEVLLYLAGHCERRGDYKKARQYARQQVSLEPWREKAHRQLMRLLALDGQRNAALAQYETCRRALAEELGVEPTAETRALYETILAGEQGGGGAGEAVLSYNLPASSTAFVGRKKELAEIADLLANPDCRLVTLFGPGGIGKTRLALQMAADHLGAFEDGVAFVPLAHIDAVEHFAPAIASSLGISFRGEQEPEEQVLNYLRRKEMLLVLDNVEHILECADFMSVMLQRAPGIVLLTTSRERLNLREEWIYDVEGLAYPAEEEPLEDRAYSAIDLYVQHARRVSSRFMLDEATWPHVARTCRLVEGMPLAVELAAAWVGVRSCEEIVQEIARGLDALTTRLRDMPERHRSIRAAFEHSWQLLSDAERALLAQLSVFRGGFREEAAVAVTGTTLPPLLDLLDKSLIRQAAPDRYDMHQLLRQYAAEKLQSTPGMCKTVQTQHAHYFAAFLDRQRPRLKTAEQRRAIEEIEAEIENARLAWNMAVSRGWAEQVEQSLEGLCQFYSVRGRFQEGIDLLGRAVDRWRDDPQHRRVFGAALARQAALCASLGYHDRAKAALEESLAIFQRLEVVSEQVFCLLRLSRLMCHRGTYDRAEVLAAESLALSRQIEDRWSVARALHLAGVIPYRKGDIDQAEALFEESLTISRQIGHQRLILWSLNYLADIACHRGDFVRAQGLYDESIAMARALGDASSEAIHLNNQGTVLYGLEDYEKAGELYLSSLQICRQISDRIGEAIALGNLGEVAHELGNYGQALVYYREGLAIGREMDHQWTLMTCLRNLGRTACAVDDDAAARTYLAEGLEIAYKTRTSTMLVEILTYLGAFFAKRGRRDRAAELLALTSQHPACHLDMKNQAKRLLADHGLAPPEGAPRSLEVVAAEVLAELAET